MGEGWLVGREKACVFMGGYSGELWGLPKCVEMSCGGLQVKACRPFAQGQGSLGAEAVDMVARQTCGVQLGAVGCVCKALTRDPHHRTGC